MRPTVRLEVTGSLSTPCTTTTTVAGLVEKGMSDADAHKLAPEICGARAAPPYINPVPTGMRVDEVVVAGVCMIEKRSIFALVDGVGPIFDTK